jgi:hypothetical protein
MKIFIFLLYFMAEDEGREGEGNETTCLKTKAEKGTKTGKREEDKDGMNAGEGETSTGDCQQW